MNPLALSLFGGFKLTLGNALVTEFESSKVQALLAYLVVEADRPHQRTALATLLWPDHPESAARTNLRHVLRHLRQILGDRDEAERERATDAPSAEHFLLATRNTIQFNTQSLYTLDVATFSALLDKHLGTSSEKSNVAPAATFSAPEIQQLDIEQLNLAAALYRGDFLAGFHVHDGELFEEWASLQREYYHRQAFDLFVYLAHGYAAAGDLARAQHYATRQIELEPWREESHRQLMLILARSNQRSAALAQYEQCRSQLAKELGVEPSPETVKLYEQIRAGAIAGDAQLSPRLPALFSRGAASAQPNAQSSTQPSAQPSTQPAAPEAPSVLPLQDWGEAPLVSDFYGRAADQATLRQWLLEERARLVTVLGMGGMGKTTLVAHTAKAVAGEFEFVFWRSLLNAPPLAGLVRESLRFLSRQQLSSLPESIHEQLNLLFACLRNHRCLLVLDNLESILEAGTSVRYRPGYEGYGYFIERMGQSEHQSCIVLTSRERPHGIGRLEGSGGVHTLQLGGLGKEAGQALLETRGLAGKAQAGAVLVQRYSGNPLALKLVARTIQEFFDGDIAAFLSDELPIFDDIRAVLDQQFIRLTPLERELLIWMAIEREAVALPQLAQNLVRAPSRSDLVEALRALQRRSLLEKSEEGFILQNVVTEYVTEYLVGAICQEIEEERLDLFHRHALVKAQTLEYVRQSQVQLLLAPVARRLLASMERETLLARLRALTNILRANPALSAGYAAGNLLNLLLHLGVEMQGVDFSRLTIRQANLRGVSLPDVNFTGAIFNHSFFTDTFNVVRAVACSPDGHRLVAGTSDGEIRVWRAMDSQVLAHHQMHSRPVNAVVFRPGGDLFASASNDFTVCLWDAATGRLLRTLHGHTGWVNAIAFSGDGKWLASAGSDQTVRVWEVESGALRHTLTHASGAVRAVAFHPHQPLLASANGAAIQLWHSEEGAWLGQLCGHDAPVTALAYRPDGKALASSSQDCTVRLWESEGGECIATLLGHQSEVRCLAFSPDGAMLASGSADYTIRLWEMGAPNALRYTLHGHVKGVNSLAFTPQGETLVSGGDDHTIHFWNPRNGNAREVWFGHTGWVRLALFSPVGSLLASCGDDGFVRLWDVQNGAMRHLLAGHRHWVWSMVFSPDGLLLASGGADHLLCIWETATGSLRHVLRQHNNTVRALAFSPDGAWLASGSADHLIHLWEPQRGELLHTLQGHTGWIQCMAFSPDGKWLASAGNDQTVCLWRIDGGAEERTDGPAGAPALLHRLSGQQATIMSVVFSPDGSLLAGAGDSRAIYVWDVATGTLRHILEGHENGVNSLAFSPDGEWLVSGASDHTVRVWDARRGEALHTLRGHSAWVRAVAFAPDGRTIASGSADHTVCLWDATTGEVRHVLRGHQHWVWSLDFCRAQIDGTGAQLLASSSVDETVRIWDAQSGMCRAILQPLGPYAGMNITGVTGISNAQKSTLKQLGAVEF